MIELKPGVRLHGIRPEVVLGIHVAEGVWDAIGTHTLVVTACIEGIHTNGSSHYNGCAVDLRTKTLAPGHAPQVVAGLKAALGTDFFILLENAGEANEHVHLEFRPQEPYV